MRNSIRKRLISTFLGIAIIPLLLIGGVLSYLAYDIQTAQALELQNQVADATTARILLNFSQVEESLALAAEHLSQQHDQTGEHDSILVELFRLQTDIDELILLDAGGEVADYLSRLRPEGQPLETMAGTLEFQEPLISGQIFYSDLQLEGGRGEPYINISIPINSTDTDQFMGTLLARYALSEAIRQELEGRSGASSHTLIVAEEGSGRIIGSTPAVFDIQPDVQDNRMEMDGEIYLVGQVAAQIGKLDFVVVAGRPLNEALGLAINSLAWAIGLTLGMCLLAIYMSMWLVRRLVEPIEVLSTAVQQVQHGNLEQTVSIVNPEDEIGRLGQAFNLMTRQLHTTLRGLETEIAERQNTEQQLRESQKEFLSLFNTMNQGVVFRDASGIVTSANPSALELVGLNAQQISRRYQQKIRFPVLDDDGEPVPTDQLPSSVALRTGKRIDNVTLAVYNERSQEYRWLTVDAVPLFLEGESTPHQVYSIFKDITAERKTDEILRQSQKIESLGMLAGGIAHDFNNLLVAMMGQTSLALRKLPDSHSARKHIEKAVQAAEHASNLTRQLLDYSGQGVLQVQPLDLNGLLNDNLHLFRVAIPKNVELESHLRSDLPLVAADGGHIQQVAMNLIINAAQAIGEKPGRVTVVTDLQEIQGDELQYTRIINQPLAPGLYTTFEVHDTGHGMTEEQLKRIFDPFFTTKTSGRGLGLAAALGIVRGHKGAISVYSEVGQGTSFKILLPVAQKQEKQPSLVGKRVAAPGPRSGNILIIDDETAVAEAAKDILDTEGFQVTIADGGEAGVNAFQASQDDFQLVLLDLTMPGLSGEETFRQLRSLSSVPILLTSGYNRMEAIRQFTDEEPSGFIQKPYTAVRLVEAVCQHINGSIVID